VLVTSLTVLNTLLLAVLIMFLLKFKREVPDLIPDFEEIGTEFAGKIGETIKGVLEGPAVSKAMGILGKHSGEARADKALQKKVAGKLMDQMPGIGMILEQFDLTPVEGLKLMNDPLVGPLIQRGLAAAQGAIGKFGQHNNPGSTSGPGVPEM